MKEVSENQKNWKSEELRAERKARLAELKSKDGGKKPIRTGSRLATIIVIIVLVLALIGTGIWGALRLGFPQQKLTAMTVGSEKISVVEFNYYYHNTASQFQVDLSDPASEKYLQMDSGVEGFDTLEDYLKDIAAQQAQLNTMLASQAAAEGLVLGQEDFDVIDNFYATIESNAKQSEVSTNAYLVLLFGKGATKDTLQPVLERFLLAQKFSGEKLLSFDFSEDEINSHYLANINDFDRVTYRTFTISAEYETDADDEEKEDAIFKAKLSGSVMLTEITDEESFREACIKYAKDEDAKADYENSDRSLMFNKLKSSVAGTEGAEWLFDSSRKEGDKKMVETSTGVQILMFISRSDSDFPYVDVNHILIGVDKETATDDEIADAQAKAEEVLSEYMAGEKSQDAFEQLAIEYSEDGNASAGGLYEDIYPGQMVAEFEQWCYDSGRKTGDTGIVETEYGFHVMYYAGTGEETDREIRVTDALRADSYDKFVEETLPSYPYEFDSFGFRFST